MYIVYIHLFIYTTFQRFRVFKQKKETLFENMFTYTENDTEFHNNIENPTLTKHIHTHVHIFVFKNTYFEKKWTFDF